MNARCRSILARSGMAQAVGAHCDWLGKKNVLTTAKCVADSGFHSRKNLESLIKQKVDAYIADNQ